MQNPEDTSSRSSSTTGLVILVVLMLGVAGWMSTQRPAVRVSATSGITPPEGTLPGALAGFRPEAWFLPDDDLLGFVEIPAGPFQMGGDPTTDRQAFENERWSGGSAQGTVDLPAFYLNRYEVTVAQFAAFVAATGFDVDDETLQGSPTHPVTAVSWPDALAYCRWLDAALQDSALTPPALSRLLQNGWQVTLPSEAEWEKAARGADGRVYPWGDTAGRERANYQGQGTTPVGSYPCADCPYGLLDMSGNVWEWTRSPYQPYPFDPSDDGGALDGDALWVMRGGSFTDPERNVRAATRGGGDPGARRPFMGFRVAISSS
jgi:formylglycine-generating enzyme required for sulfatase activity